MVVAIVIIAIIVIAVLVFVFSYNGLVQLRNRIDGAWSQIDVQLQRRHDLIPNLVETVKGYAAHERETLDETQVFGGAHEVALRGEVRRLYNQRCPFPPATRITVPLPNSF